MKQIRMKKDSLVRQYVLWMIFSPTFGLLL